MLNYKNSRRVGLLFVLPLIAFVAVFMIYPIVFNVRISFTDWNGIDPEFSFVGAANYLQLFRDPVFLTILRNFLLFAVCTVGAQAIIGFFLADLFQNAFPGKDVSKAIIFMPAMFSTIIIGQIFYRLLDPNIGYLASPLKFLGISAPLSNSRLAFWVIILINIWQWTGYSMTLYYGQMTGISQDLLEAAIIDGASHGQVLRYVTFPLCRGTTFNLTIVGVISSLKQYDLVSALTGGGPANSTQTFATYLYKAAFSDYKQGYASAIAVVMFIVAAIITAFQLKIYNQKSCD